MHPTRILSRSILKRSSYYESDYRQSAALIRARRPYIFKNMAVGSAIFVFVIGVFSFTINAVGQDKFEDVIVPNAPTQPPKTPNVGTNGVR